MDPWISSVAYGTANLPEGLARLQIFLVTPDAIPMFLRLIESLPGTLHNLRQLVLVCVSSLPEDRADEEIDKLVPAFDRFWRARHETEGWELVTDPRGDFERYVEVRFPTGRITLSVGPGFVLTSGPQ